jgi:cysteine desulfurase family protein (TIGR01976 family)
MGIHVDDSSRSIVESLRAEFPALGRREGGRPVAYFDGPGGTQVPQGVVDAMRDHLIHHNANTHWAFPTSQETDEAITEGRQALADFLNAEPAEIAFGANMTSLTFHLARALGRRLGPGDEIVVTELDHHANIAPWRALAIERGVTVRTARMRPETGQLDEDDLERKINEKTRVLAIGAASNALGTINHLAPVVQRAHALGALVFVDAVHYASHELVNVRKLDCDFLTCSAYKFYGPHIGILFGKRALIEALDVPKLDPAPDTAPERLETGTQNHEGIVGAARAVDFLAGLGMGRSRRERLETTFQFLHARGRALLERLWEGLSATNGVRLFGPPPSEPRTPTVAFTVNGVAAAEVARRLAAEGIFVSDGHFYAATVVVRLGLARAGLVRAGCACYTTEEEVDRLLDGVRRIAFQKP